MTLTMSAACSDTSLETAFGIEGGDGAEADDKALDNAFETACASDPELLLVI